MTIHQIQSHLEERARRLAAEQQQTEQWQREMLSTLRYLSRTVTGLGIALLLMLAVLFSVLTRAQ